MNNSIDVFSKDTENWRTESRFLWSHVILINATVLGFSIGTTQIRNIVDPNLFLITSWTALIVSVALGILILKLDQDLKVLGDVASFEFKYNFEEISKLSNQNTDEQNKKKGLMIQTILNNPYIYNGLIKQGSDFSDFAKALARKYEKELPSAKLFKNVENKKFDLFRPINEYLRDHYSGLSRFFYIFTVIAYIAMLISVFTGPYFKAAFPTST